MALRTRPRDVDNQLLAGIRDDILKITLPSWIPGAPKKFGTVQHGKLKADEWRTMGTIILVISLGIRWSRSNATERQKELLSNFFDLVIAINHATRRSISSCNLTSYDEYMGKYVLSATKLFGEALVPNNHLALHLSDVLARFGPAHGCWAYPFERYNGIISRISTNNKIGKYSKASLIPVLIRSNCPLAGELEGTFMRSFASAANFRSLLVTAAMQDEFSLLKPLVAPLTTEASWAPHLLASSDLWRHGDGQDPLVLPPYEVKKATALSTDTYRLLSEHLANPPGGPYPRAQQLKQVARGGAFFAAADASKRSGNSMILFKGGMQTEKLRVGQIAEIFLHTTGLYFKVHRFPELNRTDRMVNPFASYPEMGVRVCYSSPISPELVLIGDVVCHFASWRGVIQGIEHQCVVALSLDRVRPAGCFKISH